MILNIGIGVKSRRVMATAMLLAWISIAHSAPSRLDEEPVEACVFAPDALLSAGDTSRLVACLGWQIDPHAAMCRGSYRPLMVPEVSPATMEISADRVTLSANGRSTLSGHVMLHADQRVVDAPTAYVIRDAKTQQIKRIELLGAVHYVEPEREVWAQRVQLNPVDQQGAMTNALYRMTIQRAHALLPAWGLAGWMQRFTNQDWLLRQVTYTTCPPPTRDWLLAARDLYLDHARQRGVAHDVWLKWHDWPLLYTPYLTFPISKARKSGFLMPIMGYSSLGGLDMAAPYYWNIAPNYDATLIPHVYALRGLMLGTEARWLTSSSSQYLSGYFLPADRAYHHFLTVNAADYPQLRNQSDNRWSFVWRDDTTLNDEWHVAWNYQRISDDYYLQDFSTNLVLTTENQLEQTGVIRYTSSHWFMQAKAESYQTLNPINQAAVSPIYQRLPQLLARGVYDELPLNSQVNVSAQYDQFRWPGYATTMPQGPRLHLQPSVSMVMRQAWGYIQPQIEWIDNYYQLDATTASSAQHINRSIPRYSVDSGLILERQDRLWGSPYTQTLEPRVYYLKVPYRNQSSIPAFDSAYMIFSTEQLFRANRFSGIDRIGDTNQLAYALTSRWLMEATGRELASATVGQLRYFADRRVQLCYQVDGQCTDSPLFLGYLPPTATTSPIASRATLQFNSMWSTDASWIWDPATRATNNTNINLAYQPEINHIVRVGYSYLVSGNVYQGSGRDPLNTPLHQATTAVAWPLTSQWSAMAVYSYNISEQYDMLTFFGTQYDSCCWAVRVMGGRVFDSLSNTTVKPQYNNNVYVQIVLKGLGSVGNTDPASTIQSYLPGYVSSF